MKKEDICGQILYLLTNFKSEMSLISKEHELTLEETILLVVRGQFERNQLPASNCS